jgi:muramoyltetrapeptide carboxypeptidase
MLKPRALGPGSRLALIAPASPFDRVEFDRGVDEVRRLGFEPVFEPSVFARERYVAGSADLRAAAFRQAWTDTTIDGLVAVRGGYGSAQVLPLISREEIRRTPKVFVGYSDVTAMLTYLTLHCGLVAFHGPMIDQRLSRGTAGFDLQSFERTLCRPEPAGELAPEGLEIIRSGEAAGTLLGGTLTQLVASLGTPYAFDPPGGYVLFLEDHSERPYRLDRMVLQLRQAGVLNKAAAVVIGELPNCDEPGGDPAARAVMVSLFADFPGPVLIGFPSGHTTGPTMTLPLGVKCRVEATTTRSRLVIEEAAVV